MEINYIFVLKEKSHIENTVYNQVKRMLLGLFNVSELDCFDMPDDKGNFNKIHTYLSADKDNDKIVHFKIVCDDPEAQSAKILDNISQTITNGEHRKDFYITKAYDEASHSFCCRLMSPFGRFERKLRQLIYLTVIKCFGASWITETFEKNLQDELKGKIHGHKEKLVESALEELTYENLKNYLFEPKRSCSLEELVDNKLSTESIKELSKEEIIKYVEQSRKIRLWDQLFKEYENILSVSDDIDELQSYRNIVMHHKTLSFKDFTDTRKKLNLINNKLEKAIKIVETKIYNDYDYINIAQSISQTIEQTAKQFAQNTVSLYVIIALAKTFDGFIKSYKEKAASISSEQGRIIPLINAINNINTPKISTKLMPSEKVIPKITPGLSTSETSIPSINTELSSSESQCPEISTEDQVSSCNGCDFS